MNCFDLPAANIVPRFVTRAIDGYVLGKLISQFALNGSVRSVCVADDYLKLVGNDVPNAINELRVKPFDLD